MQTSTSVLPWGIPLSQISWFPWFPTHISGRLATDNVNVNQHETSTSSGECFNIGNHSENHTYLLRAMQMNVLSPVHPCMVRAYPTVTRIEGRLKTSLVKIGLETWLLLLIFRRGKKKTRARSGALKVTGPVFAWVYMNVVYFRF